MSILVVVLTLLASSPQSAASWLQWGGPTRDFRVAAEHVGWSGEAPRRAWQRNLGDGFSAVVGDAQRVFTAYRRGGAMVVAALDAATGQPAWEHVVDTAPLANMFLDYGQGPNATPVVANGRLFITSFTGRLLALDAATGKPVWQRELWSDLKGTFRDVGYSNTAIVYDDLVILPVGGTGKALAAFRQRDGSIVWQSGDFENAMSTPILIDVDGQPQVVAFMVEGVAGFDPAAGTPLWFHPHKTQYAVNSSTPVWHAASKTIIVSSAYDQGARAIRLRRDGGRTIASEAWFTRRLRVHHGNMLVLAGHVYGSSGDFGPAPLTAVDVRTGGLPGKAAPSRKRRCSRPAIGRSCSTRTGALRSPSSRPPACRSCRRLKSRRSCRGPCPRSLAGDSTSAIGRRWSPWTSIACPRSREGGAVSSSESRAQDLDVLPTAVARSASVMTRPCRGTI